MVADIGVWLGEMVKELLCENRSYALPENG